MFTDHDCSEYKIPKNVHIYNITLDQFKKTASDTLRIPVNFTAPYKVCDFRPALWFLLPFSKKHYDFWGHCDLDMIFGQMDFFITPEILNKNEKIFSVGHLTLYKNCANANMMFQRNHPQLNWKNILSDKSHKGFDEHIGVNLIWKIYNEKFYENESIIADIDPKIFRLELTTPSSNHKNQIFYFDHGKVIQGIWKRGELKTRQFMYIHFQKRKMSKRTCGNYSERFLFTPEGFEKLADLPGSQDQALAIKYNPLLLTHLWSERLYRTKKKIKHLRQIIKSIT